MISEQKKVIGTSIYNNYHEVLIPSGKTKIVLSIYETNRDSPCIIFLPGTMTHPLFYDEFLSLLSTNGFNVIGIHFISHGKSPREIRDFAIHDMIQNVEDTITYTLNNFHQKPVIMGSSQGGILSLLVAGIDHRIHSVFAHNVLLTSIKDSIRITRFPAWFQKADNFFRLLLKGGSRLMPALPVPGNFYLDLNRVFRDEKLKKQFLSDPLGRISYPLRFITSLITVDTSCITDGSIRCPVIVIASKRDPLFPFDYCLKVYNRITAPHKEMLLFDEPNHLLFNECIGKVSLPIIEKLKEFTE